MLDLDHLANQTLGNRALEREVLELFAAQIGGQVEGVQTAENRRQRSRVAHTIVGSAVAIGAFCVARVAARIEAGEEFSDTDIAELVETVERTRAFIVARLAE